MIKCVRMLTLLVSVLMMGFLACGNDNPASSEKITLTIENGLVFFDIQFVYISPSESDSWGNDRLGANILAPGERVTQELAKGTYDIKVVDVDGDEYIKRDLQLNSDYTWRVRLSDMFS